MTEAAAEADASTAAPAAAPPAGQGARRRTVAVVMNGAAGALLDAPDAAKTLADLFTANGLEPDFVPTDAGTLPERVELAYRKGRDILVVGGGDGTVACAAQVLAGTAMPLGVLPFGTMNLLAKDLGIPIDDREGAVRVLAEGVERAIDVAEVDGRVYLCASMLGLPAQIGRHREAQRGSGLLLLRWVRFARAALRAIRAHGSRGFVLELDGQSVPVRAAAITIVANALDDASGRLFGRARLDGGELAIYVVDRLRPADILRLGAGLALGRWRRDAVLREYRARTLKVRARRAAVRLMNDGEGMLLEPPLEYRIRSGALRVIAAAPGDAE